MPLLDCQDDESFRLTEDFQGSALHKPSYSKIQFCGKQTLLDGLRYFWVDTCCINRSNHSELTEAINSMFNWYKNSTKYYVYLSDVIIEGDHQDYTSSPPPLWNHAFCNSRSFTRGWTLQGLLAPSSVELFSSNHQRLGNRTSLAPKIHETTGISLGALYGASYLDFSTRRPEDIAYCMLGLFNVHLSFIYGRGMDNAFRRVQEEIHWRQRISNETLKPSRYPTSAPRRALWTVPFGRNKHFVGWELILSRLLDVVSSDADVDDCQQTTHIALELVYRLREHRPECSVFWVPAMPLILRGSRMGIDKLPRRTMLTTLIFQRGSILLTTRNHDITTGLGVPLELIFPVDGLNEDDAASLLGKNILPRQTRDATSIQELLDILVNLPLAIRQASSYMATTGMTTAKCLAHCRSRSRSFIKLLSKDIEDKYRYKGTRNPVATTWLMSFNLLMEEKPLAAKYLRFMFPLSEKEIPMYLLPMVEDEVDAEEAIDSALFNIHQLVPLATQNWIKLKVIGTLASTKFAVWSEYLSHALAALELRGGAKNSTVLLSLTSGMAEGNDIIGKYVMVEQIHRKTLAMRLETLGEMHPDTLANFDALAPILRRSGKLKDASQLYRKALTLTKQSLNPIHSVRLHTLKDFAILLQRQGEYEEAENLHRATFSLFTATLGANHPSTLDCKRNIAYTLRKQGRYSEAEPLQREVLASTETVFGTHHPETMQNLNNLASTLLSQGHAEEAERMYRLAMLGLVNELGDAHPKTLKSKSNLARTLTTLGKCSQAEAMHREVLEAMTLGMSKLGVSLWRQEKYTEAEQIHREALEIYNSTLGPGHPDTIRGKKAAELTRLRSEWEKRRRVADREGS
ncbi:kinesin light chain 1 [Nemania sp. FL0031]|nr:kinesin light chain 1 [Nemania sp. FL0031]